MKKFLKGFVYAWRGIVAAVRSERNMKFHAVAALCVVVAGFVLQISPMEWAAVLLCCGLVISAEMVNTAIEKLCDVVEPNLNEKIRAIKDIAAGAVWVCAIAAACVGVIVFLPKIIELFA
jgi:diacylglycerol kinase